MCSVSRRSSGFTSRAFGLGLSDLFGVGAARTCFYHALCSHHLFALDEIPAGKTNNCSVQLAAGCKSELLFVPEPAGKLGSFVFRTSDFTIVRYLGAARCCRSASSPAWQPRRKTRTNYCSFLAQLHAAANRTNLLTNLLEKKLIWCLTSRH